MSKEKMQEIINKVAKGPIQVSLTKDILTGGSGEFNIYMKSQRRSSSYMSSFHSLFSRMENEGYPIQIVRGKLGGYWTAKAKLA